MERVETLLQKLQTQLEEKKPASVLLLTVRQLEAELQHLQQSGSDSPTPSHISVDIPAIILPPLAQAPVPQPEPVAAVPEALPDTTPIIAEEEKIIEILQVDEEAIAAELEEIRLNAETRNNMSHHHKPIILFDEPAAEIPDIPTLTHQPAPKPVKEINDIATEAPSLNDSLRQGTMELGEQLSEAPVRDLKKAIGINDRFQYINELFRGDETMYERSIKTINGFSILPEAEYWIQRELKVKLGWSDANDTVKQFAQLVRRRFS